MTNERAIQILKILISIEGDVIIEGEYKKALEMAIRSLQQEQPCDTCTNDKGCVTCKDGELWEGKEQPCEGFDEAYLNEKIAKASKTWEGVDVDKYMAEMRGYEQPSQDLEAEIDAWYNTMGIPVSPDALKETARHFYILGLKNNIPVTQITLDELAKEGESVNEDLAAAARRYAIPTHMKDVDENFLDEYPYDPVAERAFKAGAEWQKSKDESRRMANIRLANTDVPVDADMEIAFNDIWRDAEVIVERDGTLDEKATELMKAVCHDFFESGIEWQKEQDQPITGNNLEKEWLRYVDKKKKENRGELPALGEYGWLTIARHFANWQKSQMLKDAVEGEVCGRVRDHINVRFADGVCVGLEPKNISHIPADISKYAVGDRVKIVIVPIKEDKK